MIRNVEYAARKKLQKTYLDGLRRYKCRGIPIIIDGEECPEKDWERIFEMSEDGGFYMGDYVGAEQGCLREIRFDKVYLCDPPESAKGRTRGKVKGLAGITAAGRKRARVSGPSHNGRN